MSGRNMRRTLGDDLRLGHEPLCLFNNALRESHLLGLSGLRESFGYGDMWFICVLGISERYIVSYRIVLVEAGNAVFDNEGS
jgi:hypothetical protein